MRLLFARTSDAGDCLGDLLLQLALAGLGRWLFERVGEHLGQAEHPVTFGERLRNTQKFHETVCMG